MRRRKLGKEDGDGGPGDKCISVKGSMWEALIRKDLGSHRSGKFSMSGKMNPEDLRFEEFFLDL